MSIPTNSINPNSLPRKENKQDHNGKDRDSFCLSTGRAILCGSLAPGKCRQENTTRHRVPQSEVSLLTHVFGLSPVETPTRTTSQRKLLRVIKKLNWHSHFKWILLKIKHLKSLTIQLYIVGTYLQSTTSQCYVSSYFKQL